MDCALGEKQTRRGGYFLLANHSCGVNEAKYEVFIYFHFNQLKYYITIVYVCQYAGDIRCVCYYIEIVGREAHAAFQIQPWLIVRSGFIYV